MLNLISSFFVSVGDFFSKIWVFLVMIWESLTQFFRILKPAIDFFQTLLSSIHPLFFGFGIAMLVVLLLYMIIGRTAGGD